MTDQRDETGMHDQQDEDEGMGGQNIGDQGGSSSGADWSMGQGDTGSSSTGWQQGGSTDNDGGTSGDYIANDDSGRTEGDAGEGNG
jgi:hypothetical protein